jgi:glycosyltransferase involved in cell wall biosynthesis
MDKTNTLVSIVVPTYNHSIYLKRALESIINQTYENWEVIVIDNHSTDNTFEVIANFKNNRIKYLKVHNKGIIAISRNIGIKSANGEWIAFLDSDDWWTRDKLEICIQSINEKVDFIYHDLEIIANKSKIFSRKKIKSRKLKKPVLIDLLTEGNAIGNSSVFVRKKFLDEINGIDESKELVAAEDYNTWLRIAKLTDQFVYLKKRLGYYLVHDQSVSKKDMSIPARYAIKEFSGLLTQYQKTKQEAFLKYISGRFNFLNLNYKKSMKDLLFTLKNGGISLKVRSLYMIIIIKLTKGKYEND